MAERGELHHTHLPTFRAWLDQQGIEHRPGRGAFEVMQVKYPKHYRAIYRRAHAPEHVSVPKGLHPLVRRFLKKRRSEP